MACIRRESLYLLIATVLLAVVTSTATIANPAVHDRVAFAYSPAFRSRSPSTTAVPGHASSVPPQSRPTHGWGRTCVPAAAAARHRRPASWHAVRPNERPGLVVVAASSGLRDSPGAAAATATDDVDSGRRRQGTLLGAAGVVTDESSHSIYVPGGRGAGLREGYKATTVRVTRRVVSDNDGGASAGAAAAATATATTTTAAAAAVVAAAAASTTRDIYVPGGRGAGLRRGLEPKQVKPPVLWSKPVDSKLRWVGGRFKVLLVENEDLDEAGALCIKVFFGEPDSPWKAAQLRHLMGEQRQDLDSRCNRKESVMFKAVDSRRDDAMVGFIEVSKMTGSKYGMGSGVPLSDTRPIVSNLAVDPRARRFGIGTALMAACEDMVESWCFDEIILQVEEDNKAALAFYGGLGFYSLFVDRGARRYDTSGFLLQNVRTSKITMRKSLISDETSNHRNADTVDVFLSRLLSFLMKPFVARPPPSDSARRLAGPAAVENLFGSPDARKVGSRSSGSSPPPLERKTVESGLPTEVKPVRLRRTQR